MLVVNSPYRVLQDGCITIAQLIVFLNEGCLGFLVSLWGEFLCFKDVLYFSCLVNFSEGTLLKQGTGNLIEWQFFVTIKDNLANLHLWLLVNSHVEDDFILTRYVVALCDIDFGVVIAFIIEVLLGKNLGAVNHVWRNLTAFHDAQLGLHVFAFGLLQTIVVDGADTWASSQINAEIYLVANNRVGSDRNLRE